MKSRNEYKQMCNMFRENLDPEDHMDPQDPGERQ